MKTVRKIVYFLLGCFILLIVIAAVAVGLFANSALKIAIEAAGTKALSVGVAVEEVELSILGGRLGLADLGGDNNLDTVGLSRTILLAVAGGIAEQGTDVLPKEMLGSITTELKKLGGLPDILTQTGVKVLGAGADAGKGTGEGVLKGAEDVSKGIKDLFETKKD